MRHQSGCRSLSVGSCNRQAALAAGDFAQNLRAFHHFVAALPDSAQLSELLGNRRGIDHQGPFFILWNQVRAVLIVDGNALLLKFAGKFAWGAVVA